MGNRDVMTVANEFAGEVKKNFNPSKIILFGSYVKGNFHENSDIDIAVVLEDFENKHLIQLELMRLRRKIDSRIEPHPFRKADFNNSNPVVNEILRFGQEIKSHLILKK